MKLKDKVAIVAGGGQGIGEGIIKCLAKEGADIAVVDINPDIARKTAEQVKAMGRKALPIIADLTKEDQVNQAVKDTVDFFGKVDILVNNVGGVSTDTIKGMAARVADQPDMALLPDYLRFSPNVWDKYYELNLKSHVMLSYAVTPYFVKQRSGKIVNISSVSGRLPDPTQIPYGAMKAGDISLTWTLAKALAQFNVNVNCVCPGVVYTPLWERGATANLRLAQEALREAQKKGGKNPPASDRLTDLENMTPREYFLKYVVPPLIPLGREQTPEDMGLAVVFLVSEDAKNITGQVLHVDGGFVMR